jgi:hypothetical protein
MFPFTRAVGVDKGAVVVLLEQRKYNGQGQQPNHITKNADSHMGANSTYLRPGR